MRNLALTPSARAARNEATLAQADDGAGNASIKLYDAPGGNLLAVRQLSKPCGVLQDGRIALTASAGNDLVAATGAVAYGEWVAADGTVLATGPATDAQGMVSDGVGGLVDSGGIGPWVLGGTSGTQLYQGGLVLLDSGLIG